MNRNGSIAGLSNPKQPQSAADNWNGSYLYFGSYQNGSADDIQNIRWRILQEEDQRLFLLSDKVLDCVPYSSGTDRTNVWKDSELRKWLQDTFYNQAFTEQEKSAVLETNKETGTKLSYLDAPSLTGERVFALSAEEAVNPEYGFWKSENTAQDNGSTRLKATAYANKIVHVRHIVNDEEWKVIGKEYKLSYLSKLSQVFYWLLLHKLSIGIIVYTWIINFMKSVKGRR